MRKSDKKINNNIRNILNQVCEQALIEVKNFVWLTHLVNYDKFPLPTNSINDYFGEILVLRAYDKKESIFDARIVTPANAEQTIGEFFQQAQVDFIIARFAAYGCYSLRLDRK